MHIIWQASGVYPHLLGTDLYLFPRAWFEIRWVFIWLPALIWGNTVITMHNLLIYKCGQISFLLSASKIICSRLLSFIEAPCCALLLDWIKCSVDKVPFTLIAWKAIVLTIHCKWHLLLPSTHSGDYGPTHILPSILLLYCFQCQSVLVAKHLWCKGNSFKGRRRCQSFLSSWTPNTLTEKDSI